MPKVHPHDPPRPDICRICLLLAEDSPRGAAMRERYAPQKPCRHRGGPTGLEVPCRDCSGRKTPVPLLACAVHGRCSTERLVSETACCKICPDREEGP